MKIKTWLGEFEIDYCYEANGFWAFAHNRSWMITKKVYDDWKNVNRKRD